MSFLKKMFCSDSAKADNFIPALFQESTDACRNPARGWYRIVYFDAGESPADRFDRLGQRKGYTLELVVIDIGAFQDRDLTEEGCDHIREVLSWYRCAGLQIVLRVVYDHEGKAPEREPFLFGQVQRHMQQVAEILQDFRDVIFVYQGVLLGNWGEMHTSKFLSAGKIRQLTEILCRTCGDGFVGSVRKPVQWRMLYATGEESLQAKKIRTGLFDDGIFGSETDLGTYGHASKKQVGWTGQWLPEEELEFQEKLCVKVPNGGEALYPESGEVPNLKSAVERLKRMRVTYLNAEYDPAILEYWRQETWTGEGPWQGVDGYTYIGRHLGYRFVLRGAAARRVKKEKDVYLLSGMLENVGFGGLYEKTSLYLNWKEEGGALHRDLLVEDLSEKNEDRLVEFTAKLHRPIGKVSLQMVRDRDGKAIRFANVGAEETGVLLGHFQEVTV
ncbi:MAG: DUF4874 domain-containing protein [Acetatifactor sp.]